MRVGWVALCLFACATSCDFDSAFARYCKDNAQCVRDAGVATDTRTVRDSNPGPEPISAPDADEVADADLDLGVDASADVGSGPEANLGPDAYSGRDLREGEGGPPIPPPRSCVQNSDCGADELCHPFGQVCMRLCNTSFDCPRWLDTCSEIRDASGAIRTGKVCKCSMAQNCYMQASGFMCHPVDNLCEKLCTSTQDCASFAPQRVCDTLYGLCQIAPPGCTSNRECPTATQPRCDPVTSRCVGCVTDSDCDNRPDGLLSCSSGACTAP